MKPINLLDMLNPIISFSVSLEAMTMLIEKMLNKRIST